MRLTRARLTFLCLAALDDTIQRCATTPADPSPQFRAVLATLYALGERAAGRDGRPIFDAIWRVARLAPSHTLTEHQANHRRTTELGKLWPQVCRHVGIEPTTALTLRLAALRHRGETTHQRFGRMILENEQARRVFKAHRRQKQQCTISG